MEYEELDEDKLLDPTLFEISKAKKSKDKISGVMKNNSGEDYSYLSLYFDLLDKEGNKIGQSSSTISDFEDGKSWKFEDYIYSFQKNSTVDTEHPYIKGN